MGLPSYRIWVTVKGKRGPWPGALLASSVVPYTKKISGSAPSQDTPRLQAWSLVWARTGGSQLVFLSLFLFKEAQGSSGEDYFLTKHQRALGTEPTFSIQEVKMQKRLGQDLDSGGGGQCSESGTGMAANRLHSADVDAASALQWLADTVCAGNRELQWQPQAQSKVPRPCATASAMLSGALGDQGLWLLLPAVPTERVAYFLFISNFFFPPEDCALGVPWSPVPVK